MILKKVLLISFIGFIIGSSNKSEHKDQWTKITREKITIDNVTYYFSSKIEMERRKAAIKECQNSIIENLELINEKDFTNKFDVEFLQSREEMLKYTGMAAQGMAFPDRNTFFTLLKDKGSPIKHEMMHMITMHKWGTPHESSAWMNEGLATYSGGLCFDYSLSEIYKYFIQSNKLIPMENLANNFWGYNDMITYTQSAFVCKFLIDNYGLEKFKLLWKKGFDEMQSIYGFKNKELEVKLANYINQKHPNNIEFDWDKFNEGC